MSRVYLSCKRYDKVVLQCWTCLSQAVYPAIGDPPACSRPKHAKTQQSMQPPFQLTCRTNVVNSFTASSLPVCVSVVTVRRTITAPLPLSCTSSTCAVVDTVAEAGRGALSSRYCSPCKALACSSTCTIRQLAVMLEFQEPVQSSATLRTQKHRTCARCPHC